LIHDLTLVRKKIKWGYMVASYFAPFPLDGEGKDRGIREPIKAINPTFVLPVKGKE